MGYRSVMVTRRGGLDAVAMVERPLSPPGSGQVLVRVLTAPVCQDDVAIRRVLNGALDDDVEGRFRRSW